MSEETQVLENGAEITPAELELFEETADEIAAEIAEVSEYVAARESEAFVSVADVDEDDEIEQIASSAYRVVDLRGRFCPARSSWANNPKRLGVVGHYNGGPVPLRAWRQPLAWIKFISDLHAAPGRFARGWKFNGIAYHEWVLGNTVYRLRNWTASLPHCGNLRWNQNALGLHIPIGGSQRPVQAAQGTMVTFQRRSDAHLRRLGQPRSHLVGHKEVGASSCPGHPIMAGILRYRRVGL